MLKKLYEKNRKWLKKIVIYNKYIFIINNIFKMTNQFIINLSNKKISEIEKIGKIGKIRILVEFDDHITQLNDFDASVKFDDNEFKGTTKKDNKLVECKEKTLISNITVGKEKRAYCNAYDNSYNTKHTVYLYNHLKGKGHKKWNDKCTQVYNMTKNKFEKQSNVIEFAISVEVKNVDNKISTSMR